MLETLQQRSERIIHQLSKQYPNKPTYDLDGRGLHFVCEVEPVSEHPEYDKAVEVIIDSKPHKHIKMTQYYTILKGNMELHYKNGIINLKEEDKYTIEPNNIHWAKGDECWVQIHSIPGWTKEDHIVI